MNITSREDLYALRKLINFIKFVCDDTEALEYANSSTINKIFSKVIDEACELDSVNEEKKKELLKLDESSYHKERVLFRAKSTNPSIWSNLDHQSKISYIQELIYPYQLNESNCKLIVKDLDDHFKEQ